MTSTPPPLPSPAPSERPHVPSDARAGFPTGFVPVFAFGLRTALRPRRFLLILLGAIGLGALVGIAGVRDLSPRLMHDKDYYLWRLLDQETISYLLPLCALIFITAGFSREMRQGTLVYHLVRPVSRATVFLARFASGLVPATVAGTLMVWAILWTSARDVPTSLWAAAPIMAGMSALVLGSIYYVLGSLFRWGIIIGLLYTFVFESIISNARGAVQKLSMGYHVRSLFRGLVNEDMAARSKDVRDAIDPNRGPQMQGIEDVAEMLVSTLTKPQFESATVAIFTALAIAACVLAYGVWRTKRRDFPLKD